MFAVFGIANLKNVAKQINIGFCEFENFTTSEPCVNGKNNHWSEMRMLIFTMKEQAICFFRQKVTNSLVDYRMMRDLITEQKQFFDRFMGEIIAPSDVGITR